MSSILYYISAIYQFSFCLYYLQHFVLNILPIFIIDTKFQNKPMCTSLHFPLLLTLSFIPPQFTHKFTLTQYCFNLKALQICIRTLLFLTSPSLHSLQILMVNINGSYNYYSVSMGNINTAQLVNGGISMPGFRFNPKIIVNIDQIKNDPDNKLMSEIKESSLRYFNIQQMQVKGEIPQNAVIGFLKAQDSEQTQISSNADKSSYKEVLTINGKEVSFDMLYTMIGKRFHECLNTHAKGPDSQRYQNMPDQELIHTVCRNERLTFFNFLRLNGVQEAGETTNFSEEDIKEMLNREYVLYFKRQHSIDLYRKDGSFFKRPAFNELNRKFSFDFAKSQS